MSEKKEKVSSYQYADDVGALTRYPDENTVAFHMGWYDKDEETIAESRVFDFVDMPADIITALAWYGYKLMAQRAQASEKLVAGRVSTVVDRLAQLKQGIWATAREGAGPSNTMLVEAIIAYMTANGVTIDDAKAQEIRGNVKTKDYRERAKANPGVDAEYKAIDLARTKARADAARKAAKGVEVNLEGL